MAENNGAGELPAMDPDTSEATQKQLDLAIAQGDAYGAALEYMTGTVAHGGGQTEAGHYLIGYAVEEAEGMYMFHDGDLTWMNPTEENVHIEVAVRDRADGRFVPGVKVFVTVIAPDGTEVGTEEQPLLWHPMIYHYGRNWTVPSDGRYTLKVRVEPPTFMRHDEVNGMRFTEVEEVVFENVSIERGQEVVEPE
jgi:Fe2+ transport protein